ncbi:MAG: PKD domain-containing protein, partial [Bacteroidales bacterium]|nr:PKD domain-containing protein [Bacteroidales bacterium]
MGIENQSRGGALVPAIGCTGNTQLAFTRARADNKFYFFIITERGNEDKFLIDGVRDDGIIDPGAFTEMAGSGGWVVLFTNSINSNILTVGQHLVQNTGGIFHLAILNGFPGASRGRLYYGYYSDFGGLNIGATVAGTNSSVVRACYGDPVQLYAFGGTTYQWTPQTYLDDPTSNLPTAINLPPGPHNYTVEVSGGCGSGTIDLTVLISTPVIAHFETNVVSGCSPLEIQFDDQSSGTFSWQYDLGDGSPLIRYDLDPLTPYPPPPGFPNPFSFTHTYTNTTNLPIDHEITLLVKNESGCADIQTKTITVFPEIHSGFTVDRDNGCNPVEVQFTNTSWGNTDTWLWEFGDGGSSVDQDPVHEFRNLFGPGNLVFDARLIAISPYNCRDTSAHPITVSPYIEASFAYDTVAECSPHEIIITDQSIGA